MGATATFARRPWPQWVLSASETSPVIFFHTFGGVAACGPGGHGLAPCWKTLDRELVSSGGSDWTSGASARPERGDRTTLSNLAEALLLLVGAAQDAGQVLATPKSSTHELPPQEMTIFFRPDDLGEHHQGASWPRNLQEYVQGMWARMGKKRALHSEAFLRRYWARRAPPKPLSPYQQWLLRVRSEPELLNSGVFAKDVESPSE